MGRIKMIIIRKVKNFEEVKDYVFKMSFNDSTASYPRHDNKADLEKRFKKYLGEEETEVVAAYDGDTLCGVCSFFWIEEDLYCQSILMLANGEYELVMDEFFKYIKEVRKGYELFVGFPTTNLEALEYLSKHYKCSEYSVVTDYKKDINIECACSNIIEITKDNFSEYKDFHDKYALANEMYWKADNLVNSLDYFYVYAYKEADQIIGSIFARKGNVFQEIVGLFVDDKAPAIYEKLLKKFMSRVKNDVSVIDILYFIDESEKIELENAMNQGFRIKEYYKMFRVNL